jgi:hypothetical protein
MTAALNIYAHLPEVPAEGQYRMGTDLIAGVDDVWFNTTLEDGTHIVAAEPDGWEGIDFILPLDQAGGRDGAMSGPQSVAPRVLPINGAMVAPDARTLRMRIAQMRRMLGPRTTVVWEQYDFGEGLRMGLVCRAEGKFFATPIMGHQRGGVATMFSFQLVASNPPWKLGTGSAQQACAGLPAGTVSGRTYNKTYNYNYGAFTNPGGYLIAENLGDIDAWPIYTVTGPVDYPVITNEATGEAFLINSVIGAGQTVTIDSRTGVVTPSNYRIVGRPFALHPDSNTIRWRATSGSFNPDAQLCVTWRPTWR